MSSPSPPTTPANPESKMPFRSRAWEFWRRSQILIFHLPLMVAFLFGSYIALKSLDSRIGVEGFGDVFGYALNGVRICFIIFTAWWMKKWCWFDLHDRTELAMFNRMRDEEKCLDDRWIDYWIIVRDRVEWIVALAFATYWYTR